VLKSIGSQVHIYQNLTSIDIKKIENASFECVRLGF